MPDELRLLLLTCLLAMLSGAIGGFWASRWADAARRRERAGDERRRFKALERRLPSLFDEMRRDLMTEKHRFTREFFALEGPDVYVGFVREPTLVYYEPQHPGLYGFLHAVENEGFIFRVDSGDGHAAKYRMRESFVRNLVGDGVHVDLPIPGDDRPL